MGIMGHASSKDTRVLGGSIETVIPLITTLFRIILNLLLPHQADLFGSWGVPVHLAHPLPTGL